MASIRLYLLIAVLGVFLALVAALLWYRGQAIQARGELAEVRTSLAAAVAANEAQKAAIERLTAFRDMDDKLLTDLQARLAELTTQASVASAAVRELEKSDETVKGYLSLRLPDSLRGLLNKSPSR
jgi:hypothetical protein